MRRPRPYRPVATAMKKPTTELPIDVCSGIRMRTISAAINAYSIAVAPERLADNHSSSTPSDAMPDQMRALVEKRKGASLKFTAPHYTGQSLTNP